MEAWKPSQQELSLRLNINQREVAEHIEKVEPTDDGGHIVHFRESTPQLVKQKLGLVDDFWVKLPPL